ncbi:MAG: extracellular solute-binding protein [Ruminococcus sp.]|nr:extracellular solute-binding protein [Ruminococcus sp.]
MKNTLFRRVVSSAVALALSTSCLLPAVWAAADTTDTANNAAEEDIGTTGTDSLRQTSYSTYLQKHQDAARPDVGDITISGADFSVTPGWEDLTVLTQDGQYADTTHSADYLCWESEEGSVTATVEIPEDGLYNMRATYYAMASKSSAVEVSVLIDGESPYATASRITLNKVWINDVEVQGTIEQNSRNNDIRPSQVELPMWQDDVPFKDVDGLYNEPLYFYMTKGTHEITLESQRASFVLEDLTIYQYKMPGAYLDIAPSDSDLSMASGQKIILEGETANYKSARTLYPTADKTSYMTSAVNGKSPTKTRYNSIGKASWSHSTESVTWEFNVPVEGYYKLGIFSMQDQLRGMYSNRRLYIDGVVPCKEADQIKFYYSNKWGIVVPDANAKDMYFHFTAGTHQITLEAIPGEIGEIMGELDEIVYNINSYYRQIRQITGPSPDEYNNYMINVAIPTIVDDFKLYAKQLRDEKKKIENLSKSGGTEAETLEKMAIVLDKCVKKPDIIPEMMGQIKDNVTALSTFINSTREQPLEIDKIELITKDMKFSKYKGNFFGALANGFKAFIGSFFEDYNSLSDTAGGDSLECWVMVGRDNAMVVQELIDAEYNSRDDVKTKINLKLVAGGITEATFSGKGPDLALFIGGDYPIQLAARGVLTDVSQYPDYDEVKARFAEHAMTLYTYGDGVYGVPCEQRFPMLFYRTDILNEYGIDPEEDLNTWDNLINTLPTLQRNYLEVGLELPVTGVGGTVSAIIENGNTFSMLLLQQGLTFYNEEQSKTNFDDLKAIDAFDRWTKFYTTYSFTQTYDAFSRFRQGDMPVLIRDYTFYNQLYAAAPEIKGCWAFRPVPGTVREDGSIDHSANSEGSAAIIFTKAKDQQGAWQFVKWFTSKEAQTQYGINIESVLGPMGRYATANREALEALPWTANELKQLNAQLDTQKEIPVIPASYGVTRNLFNAFRAVVNNGENARDTLFWYNKDINDEITRKREDLGLE